MLLCYFEAHISYQSVLIVDATHNNPVLNVFIYLLSLELQNSVHSIQEEQPSG